VTGVSATGVEEAYSFAVTIRADELGCEQYTDWWEVLSPQGDLLYRRILNHSHVDEQPFTRSGEPVPVFADSEIIVRSHLFPVGFEGQVMSGSVAAGFELTTLSNDFSPDLEGMPPLPGDCLF
jgi:hypothetical protein